MSSDTQPTRRPVSRLRRWVYRLLMLLLVVLALELGSFVVIRMIASEADPRASETHLLDAHRNHRLNPAYRERGKSLHSPDGLRRDAELPLTKPPKTIRVVVLGTSAVYGIGAGTPYPAHPPLTNQQTIPAQLQELLQNQLNKAGADWKVEVINGGVSAYKTFHHLIHLNSRLLDYQPDIVINIDGHNDFYFSRLTDRWNEYAYSTSILVDEFNGRSLFLPFFTFNRSLAKVSNFFSLLERLSRRVWQTRVEQPLSHTRHRELMPPDQFERMSFEQRVKHIAGRQYLRDLWQIHQLGTREGYEHMVFLQPELVFESDDRLVESDRALKKLTLKHFSDGQSGRMDRIRAMFPQLFAQAKIPFHDVAELTGDGAAKERLYIDYCHLSPAGARRLAQKVAPHVAPLILKRVQKAANER